MPDVTRYVTRAGLRHFLTLRVMRHTAKTWWAAWHATCISFPALPRAGIEIATFGYMPASVGKEVLAGLRRAGVRVEQYRAGRTSIASDLATLHALGIA